MRRQAPQTSLWNRHGWDSSASVLCSGSVGSRFLGPLPGRPLPVSRCMIVERRACKHIRISSDRIGKHVDLKRIRINVTITAQEHQDLTADLSASDAKRDYVLLSAAYCSCIYKNYRQIH